MRNWLRARRLEGSNAGDQAAWPSAHHTPPARRAPTGLQRDQGAATAGAKRGHGGITGPRRIKVARNSPRSFFEHCSKRCNSNDANSKFEEAAGELRATLSRNYPHALHRTRPRGMTPVREDYTSSGGIHPKGSVTPVREYYTTSELV